MIKVDKFYSALSNSGVDFFTGIPDSLLKDFCAYISDKVPPKKNIITANEGAAISLATGHHISTGTIPLVYLQNSGIGNTINPLLSLADKEVYSIPMILMIGWRGEPGVKDEPQHIKQGRVQNNILEALEIPYLILDSNVGNIDFFVKNVMNLVQKEGSPVAIIVRKNTFEAYKKVAFNSSDYEMTREAAIENVVKHISPNSIIVSTTGMASRELFECRARFKQSHQNDFLTVGSMGHCSQIALGIALNVNNKVICIDGDGSFIMHMGSAAIIGNNAPSNLLHIVLNNGAHDSVGGQPTVGHMIDIKKIATGCGYKNAFTAEKAEDLINTIKYLEKMDGPNLIEVLVKRGARSELGRPTSSPLDNKTSLMEYIKNFKK